MLLCASSLLPSLPMSRPVAMQSAPVHASVQRNHATPAVVTHGPSTSWAAVFGQIKSLVFQAPLTTAAVVGLGVGAIAWSLVSAADARRRARARRVAMRLVKAQFDNCRLDILKYLYAPHSQRHTQCNDSRARKQRGLAAKGSP